MISALLSDLGYAGIEVDGLEVEEAYFRGRKLQGTTIQLPKGYCGMRVLLSPFSL